MRPRNLRRYVPYQQIYTDQGIYTAKQQQDQISNRKKDNNNKIKNIYREREREAMLRGFT